MTYKELTDRVRRDLWPDLEAENLVSVHDNYFQQAFYEIQQWVDCYKFSNVDVFPACASYFNCGMTVLPKPRGAIREIYTIDKLNPDTGLEDATADDAWCAKVFGQQVDWESIQRYVRLCERCGSGLTGAAAESLANLLFGVYRPKRRYPRPTDEGLEGLAKLQEGFHYPQTSTDAEGRSPFFVYAFKGGRIYIAPWVQSTESVILEWQGIKRHWEPDDLVEDDPQFERAVRLHVGHQHFSSHGNDPAKAADFLMQLRGVGGVVPSLIYQCIEESRTHNAGEAGRHYAVGLGKTDNSLFYNDVKVTYTARCPTGQTGESVTVVKEIGSVSSALSVADANARANAQAAEQANDQLVCVTPEVVYWNTPQSATANCPGADEENGVPAAEGTPVTVNIAANKYSSTVSQEAANEAAAAAALAQANAARTCTFWNKEATFEAECGESNTVPAHTYSSTVSQADADQKASNAAKVAAESLCPTVFHSTAQQAVVNKNCVTDFPFIGSSCVIFVTVIAPANYTTSTVSQLDANSKALTAAQTYANQRATILCLQKACGQHQFFLA